jgi:uncharacterized membrane protein (DUF373 family)
MASVHSGQMTSIEPWVLALVRKFVILDAGQSEPLTNIGLASAVLALGVMLWLVRDQDRKRED